MKIEKILCPIDFSKFNEAANELACELALANEARIVYLAVADQDGDYAYAIQRIKNQALKRLMEYKPTIDEVPFTHDVCVSPFTGRSIVEFAHQNEIDLIVLATHGRTGLRRILMGSVAEYVVREAGCAVLTVKPQNKAAKTQQTSADPVTARNE